MKIAQVAPLYETVPPKKYGGTERVVSWLTEELVRQGHDVTLFATGDSETAAKLVPMVPRGLRHEEGFMHDKIGFHALMYERVSKMECEFDVIHFHSDYMHLPYARMLLTPSLATTHCRMDYYPLIDILNHYRDFPVVSISDAQRKFAPELNWRRTIHHGLPQDTFYLNEKAQDYLLFVGRLCPEKAPDKAIEIARKAGIPLKIGAKVDPADRQYFTDVVKPLLKGPGVEYLGEINDDQKQELMGNALALIHTPVQFPEPFGLVMIEAMACGTPVVAFRQGSIPEVIDQGVTGFVVDGVDSAAEAVKNVGSLSRKACREIFERRFTSSRMVSDYLTVYKELQACSLVERARRESAFVAGTPVAAPVPQPLENRKPTGRSTQR